MTHPLFQRLIDLGIPQLGEADCEAYLQAQPLCVLFLHEDPQRFPESLDVAVVLPELLKAFPMLSAALVEQALEPRLQARYGFTLWPTLVFLKHSQYLGSLSRMLDWDAYLKQIPPLLARTPQIPLQTLAVNSPVSGCSSAGGAL